MVGKSTRMVGKHTRGRRKLQMLEDLYENNGYEVLRRTAKVMERKHQKESAKTLLYSRQMKKKPV